MLQDVGSIQISQHLVIRVVMERRDEVEMKKAFRDVGGKGRLERRKENDGSLSAINHNPSDK